MKKRIIIVLCVVLMLVSFVYAKGRLTTSRSTANTHIYPGVCLLFGCFVETDGTNNVTLTIYDSNGATGKIIRKIIVPGASYYGGFELPEGIKCDNGIYCTISGTGAAFWITYGIEP